MNLEFLTDKVDMEGDGVPLSPEEYGRLLAELTAKRKLGKEDALILPTGTMANFLALGDLAGQGSRVLVQYDRHVYRDSGDAVQSLGRMNLVPLNLLVCQTIVTGDVILEAFGQGAIVRDLVVERIKKSEKKS